MAEARGVIHLVLQLHETQYYRRGGRTWLERLGIRLGLVPPYPEEEEVAAVWVVGPGGSAENYEAGTDVTGPLPGARARHVLGALETLFQQLGFETAVETDYP